MKTICGDDAVMMLKVVFKHFKKAVMLGIISGVGYPDGIGGANEQ